MSKIPTIPALHDAEVLASNLVWTLEQIQQYGNPETLGIQEALILARQCWDLVHTAKRVEA